MAENSTVNSRIAGYRKLAGLTQEQVAERLGIKRNTYARMEKHGNPTPETLMKIAEILKVSVNALLYDLTPPKSENSILTFSAPSFPEVSSLSFDESQAVMIYRMLPAEKKNEVFEFLKKLLNDAAKK